MLRYVRRIGYFGYWQVWVRLAAWLAYLLSFLRLADATVELWPEADNVVLGSRIVLFVHFDRRGEVRPHTLHYLRSLHAAGLSVLFVTNAGDLRAEAREALQAFCAGILIRRNIGYDFGAMAEGLSHFQLPRPDTSMLLLANDSVYGPLQPLAPILEQIDFNDADIWGATESWQQRYHLQSYFVAFGHRALSDPAWDRFWRRVRLVQSKHWVISRYEVGLSQAMLRGGLRCAALWPYRQLLKLASAGDIDTPAHNEPDPIDRTRLQAIRSIQTATALRNPLNPTAELWRILLQNGFPFIKRELLRINPGRVRDISDWRDVVQENCNVDIALIERDLQQVMKNRVG